MDASLHDIIRNEVANRVKVFIGYVARLYLDLTHRVISMNNKELLLK